MWLVGHWSEAVIRRGKLIDLLSQDSQLLSRLESSLLIMYFGGKAFKDEVDNW